MGPVRRELSEMPPPESNSSPYLGREPLNRFDLSPEQKNTASLIHELLGTTFADRYVDFCRLAAGAFELRVSRPVAAHALRELESSLRQVLEVPMEARTPDEILDPIKRQHTEEELKELNFNADDIRAAIKALTPRVSHKAQIRKIVGRLGLAEDGDIAKHWLSLCDVVGRAHQRSFHQSLTVDDAFRDKYQRPFDTVIRAVVLALRSRYASLIRRVEELAAMSDRRAAVELFASEIPGALPLQRHFYGALQTGDWLPHLAASELLGEPLAGMDEDTGKSIRLREWPAGGYLLRMAQSQDPPTRLGVIEVLRRLATSQHPDIRYYGIEILAALPANESAPHASLAVGWLGRDAPIYPLLAPEELLKKLAEGQQRAAALLVARDLLKIWNDNGRIASLYDRFMYEYSLPSIVDALTAACQEDALRLFMELLQQAGQISDAGQYSHYSSRPITDDQRAKTDIYEALLSAVRLSAEILIRADGSRMRSIIQILEGASSAILVRVALHLLAQNPSAAPDLADAYMIDADLIEATWCRSEYATLALAWFPSLTFEKQAFVLRVVDTMPEKSRAAWRLRFEEHHKVPPTAEDERRFDAATLRDTLWTWRAVLPAERRQALERIVTELGEPDAWKNRLLFSVEESPLTRQEFSSLSTTKIVEFLKAWEPKAELQNQTVTALAQELQTAAGNDPKAYAVIADQFVEVRAVYVRHLFNGLKSAAANDQDFEWGNPLKLVQFAYSQFHQPMDAASLAEGDDRDWSWACVAATEFLLAGLRRGAGGIDFAYATQLRSLALTLMQLAPANPEIEDFEERYERDIFFAAQATLRGLAVELCILVIFWLSKDLATPIGAAPREAIANLLDLRGALEAELADQSPAGRVPRAIIGRYLPHLFYFGEGWLKTHMGTLFYETDEALKRATWLSYLWHSGQPIADITQQLHVFYADEISRLTEREGNRGNRHFQEDSLTYHIIILYLDGVFPGDLLEHFWRCANTRIRQHAMWYLGQQLQSPFLPSEMRPKGLSYFENRLASAEQSGDPNSYREELGAIGLWCVEGQIDELWLSSQLIRMLRAGFAPTNSFQVVQWLEKFASRRVDDAITVLALLLLDPQVDVWSYMTETSPIRTILSVGLARGTENTVKAVQEILGFLASKGKTGYLDLYRSSEKTHEKPVSVV